MITRSRTERIMLHTTATPEGREVTYDDLWRWHVVDNGWSHIGYHWLIQLDGTVVECRPERYQGAGCSGQNEDTVHIVYSGGLTADGKTPKDTRTPEQIKAMIAMIKDVASRYPSINHKDDIVGHNQFAAKACPSFNVPDWVDSVIAGYETGNPEPGDPALPTDVVTYIRALEARIAELERWRNS